MASFVTQATLNAHEMIEMNSIFVAILKWARNPDPESTMILAHHTKK